MEIKELQHLLNQSGCLLREDGIIGDNTIDAIMSFQKLHGFTPDGKLTKPEIDRLQTYSNVDISGRVYEKTAIVRTYIPNAIQEVNALGHITRLDKEGIDQLIAREGLRLCPYKDSTGKPTIAVGNTFYKDGRKVKMGDKCLSKDEAISLFVDVLRYFEAGVDKVTTDKVNQRQYNSLVSIAFNIGMGRYSRSTFLKYVNNNPNDPAIYNLIMRYVKPACLYNRRLGEAKNYFK